MQQWGFVSSWKQMTREPGWYKPIIILALVGWIPILGQIAVLGYSYEWARLTAWGLDASPKRQGVNIGKVLGTGAWSFLVYLSMAIVAGVAVSIISLDSIELMLSSSYNLGVDMFVHDGINYSSVGLVGAALGLLVTAFIQAAMMRATLYDGFTAGWRLDRLFQMIGRDAKGFLHLYLISLIGSLVNAAYSLFATVLGSIAVFGGVMGLAMGAHASSNEVVSRLLMGVGPGIVVVGVIVFLAIAFAGAVISTAVQLIFLNAAGQWFCRFEVSRWGVSSAPLPEGVPQRSAYAAGQAPTPPASAPAADAAPVTAPTTGVTPAAAPGAGAGPVTGPVVGATPGTAPAAEAEPAVASPGDEPTVPVSAEVEGVQEGGVPSSAGEASSDGTSSEDAEVEAPVDVPSAEQGEEESAQEEKPASLES